MRALWAPGDLPPEATAYARRAIYPLTFPCMDNTMSVEGRVP
ncbi:hypothetical protein ACFLX4_00380 [Chloroflexota bacterium]